MTAINVCTSESGDSAYMIADTAVYYIKDEDAGIIQSFRHKAQTIPRLKMAIGTVGAPELSALFADECERFSTFDQAVKELPACIGEMADAGYFTRVFDNPDDEANHFRMLIAGWSDEKQRAQLYVMQSKTAAKGAGAAWAPFAMQDGQRILLQPGNVTMQALDSMGYVKAGQVRYRDPGAFLTDVINWQRRNSRFSGIQNNFCIGGQTVLTRIDANGITETVTQRWPNDRVGERIDPSRDDVVKKVPSAISEGLSRLQRERMEKKLKKGTLRTA